MGSETQAWGLMQAQNLPTDLTITVPFLQGFSSEIPVKFQWKSIAIYS